MKSVAIILLVVATTCCHAELTNDIARDYVSNYVFDSAIGQKLKSFLEDFKTIMKTGNSTLGIPILDPFKLEHQEFDIQEEKIKIKGQVDNVYVQGLSEYTVEFVDMKLGRWNLSIDLSWNEVRAKTDYDVNGEAMGNVPVYGKGDLNAEANNFRFATDLKLKVNLVSKKVEILEVQRTRISLEKLKFDISGFLNNEELSEMFSKVISDMAPQFVKDFQEEITTKVNELIKEKGNEYLKDLDLSSIIGGVIG